MEDAKRMSKQLDAWAGIAKPGMKAAVESLSQMVGQDIRTSLVEVKRVPLTSVADQLGGADAQTVAVYLGIEGTVDGHMVLMYPPHIAMQFVDMAMGDPTGTNQVLDEMERSVLGEIGNLMGGTFLRTVSDQTGLDLRVTPPQIITDMVGAVCDAALAHLMLITDEVTIVEMVFGTTEQEIRGTFLVMPNPEVMEAITAQGVA